MQTRENSYPVRQTDGRAGKYQFLQTVQNIRPNLHSLQVVFEEKVCAELFLSFENVRMYALFTKLVLTSFESAPCVICYIQVWI
jgi:hypothetical protein